MSKKQRFVKGRVYVLIIIQRKKVKAALAALDENLDLLEESKQKLDKILFENEKLNKIYDILKEIEALVMN